MKTASNLRKKIMFFVLLSLSMTVMNCSKDDAPTSQIVGSWKITNIFVKEGTKAEADQFPALVKLLPCFKDIVFIFKNNGDLTATVPQECKNDASGLPGTDGAAKFEVKDGKLTITDPDNSQTIATVTFSGKQMTWLMSETTSGVVITTRFVFTKQ